MYVVIDDASRVGFSQIYPDEKAVSAVAFLKAAIAYYLSLGVSVTRVMTDNGSCFKAHAFRDACKALGIRHIRTKPYTPRTNGKAEPLHPDRPQVMGLCQSLSDIKQTSRRTAVWAAPLQLAPASR